MPDRKSILKVIIDFLQEEPPASSNYADCSTTTDCVLDGRYNLEELAERIANLARAQ